MSGAAGILASIVTAGFAALLASQVDILRSAPEIVLWLAFFAALGANVLVWYGAMRLFCTILGARR